MRWAANAESRNSKDCNNPPSGSGVIRERYEGTLHTYIHTYLVVGDVHVLLFDPRAQPSKSYSPFSPFLVSHSHFLKNRAGPPSNVSFCPVYFVYQSSQVSRFSQFFHPSIHPFRKSFAKRKKNAQFDFPPCHAVAGIYHFHHPHVAILLTGPFAETRSLTRLFCSDAMPHLPSLRLAVKGDKGRIAATSITADVGCSPLLILPEGC